MHRYNVTSPELAYEPINEDYTCVCFESFSGERQRERWRRTLMWRHGESTLRPDCKFKLWIMIWTRHLSHSQIVWSIMPTEPCTRERSRAPFSLGAKYFLRMLHKSQSLLSPATLALDTTAWRDVIQCNSWVLTIWAMPFTIVAINITPNWSRKIRTIYFWRNHAYIFLEFWKCSMHVLKCTMYTWK